MAKTFDAGAWPAEFEVDEDDYDDKKPANVSSYHTLIMKDSAEPASASGMTQV